MWTAVKSILLFSLLKQIIIRLSADADDGQMADTDYRPIIGAHL